jgi:hypothetical protein
MKRIGITASVLVLACAAFAQTDNPAPAPGFDAEACAKHCKDVAAARQKMMDEHKAMMARHDAAMKEIHAKLDEAKKARGDKKTAALESAVEQLITLHEGMMQKMGEGMMMHHRPGDMHGMGMKGCCGGMMGMGPTGTDCPMMKGD